LGRDGADIAGDLPRKRREIFFESGLDSHIVDLPVGLLGQARPEDPRVHPRSVNLNLFSDTLCPLRGAGGTSEPVDQGVDPLARSQIPIDAS